MSKLKVVKTTANTNAPSNSTRACKTAHIPPLKAVFAVIVTLLVCAVFIFAMPTLPQKPASSDGSGYKGIINLWLVDSFEGGSGSRKQWLTARSAKYEKQNEGLFVSVTQLTEGQLLERMASSQEQNAPLDFDIICFSRGVAGSLVDNLQPLDVDFGKVADNLAISARVGNQVMAVPIFCGSYCLFARASQQSQDIVVNALTTTYARKIGKNTVNLQPLLCGFTDYNSPLTALAMSGARGNVNLQQNSQYEAYELFVANKTAVTLLGTQRDLYRLTQRLQMGKMEQLIFAPLTAYTDLVGYVAVNKDSQNSQPCIDFVQYLLSDEVQQSLVNISMFSTTGQRLYTDEWYSACEEGLKTAYVPNLFADQQTIDTQRQTAIQTLQGR